MRNSSNTIAIKDIDSYLINLPIEVRVVLEELRHTILEAAPTATEVINYQIPTFRYQGNLVGFAGYKTHYGFYIMSKAMTKKFAEELKPYETATATIRFPLNEPFPAELIKKIVKARMKENEEIANARAAKKASTAKV